MKGVCFNVANVLEEAPKNFNFRSVLQRHKVRGGQGHFTGTYFSALMIA